jgi:hypothetical protein
MRQLLKSIWPPVAERIAVVVNTDSFKCTRKWLVLNEIEPGAAFEFEML